MILQALREITAEPDYQTILPINCSVHLFNLLLGDLAKVKPIKNVIDICKKITSSVNRSSVLLGKFKALQSREDLRVQRESIAKQINRPKSKTLKIFCATRFSTLNDVVESVHINKHALQALVLDDSVKNEINKANISSSILDIQDDFWSGVNSVLKLISRVSHVLRWMESDDRKLSDVMPTFKLCRESILERDDEIGSLRKVVEKRAANFENDYYYLAFVLDPSHFYNEDERRRLLTDSEMNVANETFEEYLAKHLELSSDEKATISNCFLLYKRKMGYFTNKNPANPVNFWLNFLDYTDYKGLAYLALKLLSIVPHSCDCERMNSIEKAVHSKTRNRLAADKVEKLMCCKSYLRNKEDYKESQRNKASNDPDECAPLNLDLFCFDEDQDEDQDETEHEDDEWETDDEETEIDEDEIDDD